MQSSFASLVRVSYAALMDAGVPDAEVEASLLVRYAAGMEAEEFLLRIFESPSKDILERLMSYVERRMYREPLQYITGNVQFYDRSFYVRRGVFIPRPETELIAQKVIEFFKKSDCTNLRIGEPYVGSGVLAATLAAEIPGAKVFASDISPEAIQTALENFALIGVQVEAMVGDNLTVLPDKLDILVANPPYIPSCSVSYLQPEINFEPTNALDGGEDGLEYVRRIIEDFPAKVADEALVMIELSPVVSNEALSLAKSLIDADRYCVDILQDLAGLDRILRIQTSCV